MQECILYTGSNHREMHDFLFRKVASEIDLRNNTYLIRPYEKLDSIPLRVHKGFIVVENSKGKCSPYKPEKFNNKCCTQLK